MQYLKNKISDDFLVMLVTPHTHTAHLTMNKEQILKGIKTAIVNKHNVSTHDAEFKDGDVLITLKMSAVTFLSSIGVLNNDSKKNNECPVTGKVSKSKKWPDDMKRKALSRHQGGATPQKIAEEIGVPPSTVRGWVSAHKGAFRAVQPRETHDADELMQRERQVTTPQQVVSRNASRVTSRLSSRPSSAFAYLETSSDESDASTPPSHDVRGVWNGGVVESSISE